MRILQTRLSFSFKIQSILLTSCLILSNCVSSNHNIPEPWTGQSANPTARSAQQTPSNISVAAVEQENLNNNSLSQGSSTVKVAILLPLSGKHAKLGEAMMNAAQIALFDIGFEQFELLPKDTMGTPAGAKIAAKSALQDGAKLVLGPVFSSSVRAAKTVTESAGVNMVAFSTDWTLASKNTFLIGFLPFDQIERVISYAATAGYSRIGAISTTDNYGEAVMAAYTASSANAGIQTTATVKIPANGEKITQAMRNFARYNARKEVMDTARRQGQGTEQEILSRYLPFDAVLLPVGGATARQVGSFLNHYDLPASNVKRLGTGLMDDNTLATDRALDGTWFAAPSPNARSKFKRRYQLTYGEKAPRIASLAYDATALATILARLGIEQNNRPAFDHRSITNPNGFNGVDGIFRFRPDGISERGLAVLEYRKGKIVVIDNAPRTFQRAQY